MAMKKKPVVKPRKRPAAPITKAQGTKIIELFEKVSGQLDRLGAKAA